MTQDRHQQTTVIESAEYKIEVERLRQDPIIITLAAELIKADAEGKIDLDRWRDRERRKPTWSATRMILDEYVGRGGVDHFSIGGPSKAVISIILDLEDLLESIKKSAD